MANKKNKYICKYCGKKYYSYKDKSSYCSRECRNKDNQYIYGYGDNTKEQWDDFVEKYKGNYYGEVA